MEGLRSTHLNLLVKYRRSIIILTATSYGSPDGAYGVRPAAGVPNRVGKSPFLNSPIRSIVKSAGG